MQLCYFGYGSSNKRTHCCKCGKPFASASGSAATEKCNWRIEYEIPPLRAIYFAEAGPCTFAEACEQVKTEQPLWHIRNMKRLTTPSSEPL